MTPLEREAIEDAVGQYLAEGYEVERDADLGFLGNKFRNTRVDLAARRGDETVLIEVKSRQSARNSNLADLVLATNEMGPAYRFDVIWIGDDEPIPTVHSVARLSAEAVWVEKFSSMGAIFLAWSALECSMRICAANNGIVGPATYGRQLAAELLGSRIIDPTLHGIITRILDARNRVAYGHSVEQSTSNSDSWLISRATELADLLSSRLYITSDKATRRIREQLSSDDIEMLAIKELWPDAVVGRLNEILGGSRYDVDSIRQIASSLHIDRR